MHERMNCLFAALVLCFLMICSSGIAEDSRFSLEDAGLDLGIHSIHYPRLKDQLSDTDDSTQSEASLLIAETLHAKELTARMASVLSSSIPLTSVWDGFVSGDIVSAHMHVSGPISRERNESADYAVLLDLTDLSLIGLDQFFADPDQAESVLEEKIQEDIAPALSPHLMNAELLPLPDSFGADPWALTLYYPSDRFQTLTGNAGQIRIYWYELQSVLNLQSGSPADRLGILSGLSLTQDSAENIRRAVEAGAFPSIPAAVGDSLSQLAGQYPLLHDPDNIEGARIFELEGAPMQNVQFLTDTLTMNSYDHSVVEAIRTDNCCLYGLCTGITTQDEWRQILGEPDASVALDETQAELYRMLPGTSDYYSFGSHTLRLHADENRILRFIFIQ